MGNSIYNDYLASGSNSFYKELISQGHRNSWLEKKLRHELEAITTTKPVENSNAVTKSLPKGSAQASPKAATAHLSKVNPTILPPHLLELYNKAKDIYRNTAAIHTELCSDVYEQSNLIPEHKRADMITEIIEGRKQAIAIFERCRAYEETGIDTVQAERKELDEADPHQLLKRIQSLRSSITRFNKLNKPDKATKAKVELDRLTNIYSDLV